MTEFTEVFGSCVIQGDSIIYNGEIHKLEKFLDEGQSHSGCDYVNWETDKGVLVHILENNLIKASKDFKR